MALPKTLLPFRDCRHSVFCSHSQSDNIAWSEWIADFMSELEEGLKARIHGQRIPEAFMSTDRPLVSGLLSVELQQAVQSSFAMFIFVHDGYLESPWCLHELEFFGEEFGVQGPRQRLYVIAMSDPAIKSLQGRSEWRRLVPDDMVVVPFWQLQDKARVQPIPVFANDTRRKKIIVNTEFWTRFVRVREDLVAKIKAAIQSEATAEATYPSNHPAAAGAWAPAVQHSAHVFIEGNDSRAYFLGLSKQVVDCWGQLEGVIKTQPKLYLRPTGIDLDDIAKRPVLEQANGIILVWEQKAPESLVAQINMVEPKLTGPNAPPGLVAYLMAPGDDRDVPQAILNWPVVRFQTDPQDGSATPLPDDKGLLNRFMARVLKHWRP